MKLYQATENDPNFEFYGRPGIKTFQLMWKNDLQTSMRPWFYCSQVSVKKLQFLIEICNDRLSYKFKVQLTCSLRISATFSAFRYCSKGTIYYRVQHFPAKKFSSARKYWLNLPGNVLTKVTSLLLNNSRSQSYISPIHYTKTSFFDLREFGRERRYINQLGIGHKLS